jgi:MYXO-CTERM domain-containing protein
MTKKIAALSIVALAGSAFGIDTANATKYTGGTYQNDGKWNNNTRNTVIYDTLSITDNQIYDNGNGNARSGTGVFGSVSDLELCDDFTTTNNNVITHVVADSVTFLGRSPADGVHVEVFQDLGGVPSEAAVATAQVPAAFVSASGFTDTIFGLAGVRLSVDLAGAGLSIPLAANTSYYIMIKPVDLTASGDWYYQLRDTGSFIGGDAYGRDGGEGAGGYGTFTWVSMNNLGFGRGDTAMQISAVPAPGAAALLGLGALVVGRRRR